MATYDYKPMTPQEFARCLDEHQGMTLGQFSRLTGLDYEELRFEMLQNGTKPIPHFVRVLFALMALPGAASITRQITDAVVIKDERFNSDAKRRYGSGMKSKVEQAD